MPTRSDEVTLVRVAMTFSSSFTAKQVPLPFECIKAYQSGSVIRNPSAKKFQQMSFAIIMLYNSESHGTDNVAKSESHTATWL